MNELQIIDQREVLGKDFRVYGDFENPLFLAKDVAEWIEHSDVSTMLRTVDDSEKLIQTMFVSGQNREVAVLTEDGLYEVLMQSRKPIAKQFKSRVKAILKEIRKHGKYETPKQKQRSLGEINSAARIITQTLKEAGMPPQFRAVALQSLYAPAGVHIPLDGITVGKRTYDASTIAKMLGVFSKAGLPHGQAVGAIIDQLGIGEEHSVKVPFQNQTSGHSGVNVQYDDYVVGVVRTFLDRQNRPPVIEHAGKRFSVQYKS